MNDFWAVALLATKRNNFLIKVKAKCEKRNAKCDLRLRQQPKANSVLKYAKLHFITIFCIRLRLRIRIVSFFNHKLTESKGKPHKKSGTNIALSSNAVSLIKKWIHTLMAKIIINKIFEVQLKIQEVCYEVTILYIVVP